MTEADHAYGAEAIARGYGVSLIRSRPDWSVPTPGTIYPSTWDATYYARCPDELARSERQRGDLIARYWPKVAK